MGLQAEATVPGTTAIAPTRPGRMADVERVWLALLTAGRAPLTPSAVTLTDVVRADRAGTDMRRLL